MPEDRSNVEEPLAKRLLSLEEKIGKFRSNQALVYGKVESVNQILVSVRWMVAVFLVVLVIVMVVVGASAYVLVDRIGDEMETRLAELDSSIKELKQDTEKDLADYREGMDGNIAALELGREKEIDRLREDVDRASMLTRAEFASLKGDVREDQAVLFLEQEMALKAARVKLEALGKDLVTKNSMTKDAADKLLAKITTSLSDMDALRMQTVATYQDCQEMLKQVDKETANLKQIAQEQDNLTTNTGKSLQMMHEQMPNMDKKVGSVRPSLGNQFSGMKKNSLASQSLSERETTEDKSSVRMSTEPNVIRSVPPQDDIVTKPKRNK